MRLHVSIIMTIFQLYFVIYSEFYLFPFIAFSDYFPVIQTVTFLLDSVDFTEVIFFPIDDNRAEPTEEVYFEVSSTMPLVETTNFSLLLRDDDCKFPIILNDAVIIMVRTTYHDYYVKINNTPKPSSRGVPCHLSATKFFKKLFI